MEEGLASWIIRDTTALTVLYLETIPALLVNSGSQRNGENDIPENGDVDSLDGTGVGHRALPTRQFTVDATLLELGAGS